MTYIADQAPSKTSKARTQRESIPEPTVSLASVRQKILYATSVLLAARGYHGTRTRDIGNAVGIKGPSLYHHFDSKDGIVAELLQFSLEAPLLFIEAMAEAEGDPAVRLYRYVRFDYIHMATGVYDLRGVHNEFIFGKPRFAEWRGKREKMRHCTLSIVSEGIEAGRFISVDPTVIRELIASLVTQSLSDMRHSQSVAEARAVSQADLVIRAILVDPAGFESVRNEALSFRAQDEEFHASHTSGHPSGAVAWHGQSGFRDGGDSTDNAPVHPWAGLVGSAFPPSDELREKRNGLGYSVHEDLERASAQMAALQTSIEKLARLIERLQEDSKQTPQALSSH